MLGGSGRGPDPHAFLEACVWLEGRLREGLPVASTLLRDEAEEDGISFPTLRRAKKALEVKSIKRDQDAEGKAHWDWQLLAMRVIPQPTPLISLASLETLEHVPQHQAVSGAAQGLNGSHAPEGLPDLRQPGEDDAPQPGDEGYIPPAEVIENMEDVQETHEDQDAEEPPAAPAFRPPLFCPSCHKKVTSWIHRGTYYQCSAYKCPGKVWGRG